MGQRGETDVLMSTDQVNKLRRVKWEAKWTERSGKRVWEGNEKGEEEEVERDCHTRRANASQNHR